MREKRLLTALLPLLLVIVFPSVVQAATITGCTLDKNLYRQGETGYLTATIYNDKDEKIKVTELTATIDYYYTDGNVYLQKFFTDTTLPAEIQQGQSGTFTIPFSLPTNIATGYVNIDVRARTQLWNIHLERWFESDHPTFQPTLYIESPYKQQSQGQLVMIYLLGATSIVLTGLTAFLLILNRRAKLTGQPAT